MLYADDLSTDPTQLVAYVLIGVASGLAGALFVRLNAMWMAFRKRKAKWWLFRNKYAWSTLVVLAYTLLTIPGGPCGSYLSKSTGDGINELFANDLSSDWSGGGGAEAAGGGGGGGDGGGGHDDLRDHGGVRMMVSLCVYTGWRFLFLIVGITLPLPCGVFAPTLAIGAGIGRWADDTRTHMHTQTLTHMMDDR